MLAEKARTVSWLVQRLLKLRDDIENKRAEVMETVSLINTLTIPRCWVGMTEDGKLHVTYYAKTPTVPSGLKAGELTVLHGKSTPKGPMALMHSADYVWAYRQELGEVECMKSRCGRWVGQTLKCEPGTLPVVD